jgi:hypothetical protein
VTWRKTSRDGSEDFACPNLVAFFFNYNGFSPPLWVAHNKAHSKEGIEPSPPVPTPYGRGTHSGIMHLLRGLALTKRAASRAVISRVEPGASTSSCSTVFFIVEPHLPGFCSGCTQPRGCGGSTGILVIWWFVFYQSRACSTVWAGSSIAQHPSRNLRHTTIRGGHTGARSFAKQGALICCRSSFKFCVTRRKTIPARDSVASESRPAHRLHSCSTVFYFVNKACRFCSDAWQPRGCGGNNPVIWVV